MADYIPPDLDPASRAAIEAIQQRTLGETPESIAAETMKTTTGSQGMIGNNQMKATQAQTGADEGVLRAINERGQRKYESAIRDLGVQTQAKSQQISTDRQMRASNLLQKEQEYNDTIKQMKAKAAADRKAARAQTIGQILGIAGAAAGFGMGGGAAGAGAGYMIGSGVGTAAGGSIGGD